MTSTRLIQTLFGIVLLLAVADASAQMYRWTDAQGRVHYSNEPPPKDAKNVEQKRLRSNTVSGGDGSYALEEALKKNPVRLYTTGKCEPCNEARQFLGKRGVPFAETHLGDNDEGRAQLRKLGGADGLPVMTVGERMNKGFYPDAWDAALDSAGYSRYAAAKAPAKPAPKSPPANASTDSSVAESPPATPTEP